MQAYIAQAAERVRMGAGTIRSMSVDSFFIVDPTEAVQSPFRCTVPDASAH